MLLDIGASRKKEILHIYIFNYIDPSKNDIEKIHAPIQIMIPKNQKEDITHI
jgi:hypothetical protein